MTSLEMENSSPTNSGPDSEVASVDDLPADGSQQLEPGYTKEDLTNKEAILSEAVEELQAAEKISRDLCGQALTVRGADQPRVR